MGTYNPLPVEYSTFSQSTLSKSKSVKGFGTNERFEYLNKKKKKIVLPGPNKYNTIQNWPGKDKKENKANFMDSITTGFKPQVYYSQR